MARAATRSTGHFLRLLGLAPANPPGASAAVTACATAPPACLPGLQHLVMSSWFFRDQREVLLETERALLDTQAWAKARASDDAGAASEPAKRRLSSDSWRNMS